MQTIEHNIHTEIKYAEYLLTGRVIIIENKEYDKSNPFSSKTSLLVPQHVEDELDAEHDAWLESDEGKKEVKNRIQNINKGMLYGKRQR